MTMEAKPAATNKEAIAGPSLGNAVNVTKENPMRMTKAKIALLKKLWVVLREGDLTKIFSTHFDSMLFKTRTIKKTTP